MIRALVLAATLLATPAFAIEEQKLDFSSPSTADLSMAFAKAVMSPGEQRLYMGAIQILVEYYGIDKMSDADGYRMKAYVLQGKTASNIYQMVRQLPRGDSKFEEGDED